LYRFAQQPFWLIDKVSPMPKARARAEELVPAGGDASRREAVSNAVAEDLRTSPGGGTYIGHRGQRRVDAKASKASRPTTPPSMIFVERNIDLPCPSGKHQRSMLTFRSHTVACMFCIPCEHGWTEPTTHPALRDLPIDSRR
jgi:hypothetical protein